MATMLLLGLMLFVVLNEASGSRRATLRKRMSLVENDIADIKKDNLRMEKRLKATLKNSETTLRNEWEVTEDTNLHDLIDRKVREVVEDVLEKVLMDTRHVQNRQEQLKTDNSKLHREIRSVKAEQLLLREELVKLRDDFVGLEDQSSEWNYKDYDLTNSEFQTLTEDIEQLNQTQNKLMIALSEKMEVVDSFNNKTQEQLENVDHSIKCLFNTVRVVNCTGVNNSQLTKVSDRQTGNRNEPTASVMTTSPTVPKQDRQTGNRNEPTASVMTTSPTVPIQDRTRLLIAEYNSHRDTLYELDLNTNVLKPFPSLRRSEIVALVYDPTHNSVIFSSRSPAGIYSSSNDGHITTLRGGIGSSGMAVDAGRGTLFLSTYSRRYTMSKMGTDGNNYNVMIDFTRDNTHGTSLPEGVAVDTMKRRVYVCMSDRLLSVSYDGEDIHTLYTGTGITGVTLNNMADVLYFNDRAKLFSYFLKGENIVQVGQNIRIYNLLYHNNTLYSSDYGDGNIYAYTLNNDTVMKIAETEKDSVICLLP